MYLRNEFIYEWKKKMIQTCGPFEFNPCAFFFLFFILHSMRKDVFDNLVALQVIKN